MVQIYISHAENDIEELARFREHMGPFERAEGLSIWANAGGSRYSYREAEPHIRASDIFICLVSANYLNSAYITDSELPAIKQAAARRGALVVPIILEKSFWELEFGGFDCLPVSRRKLVLPVHQWRSLKAGFHEAAQQAAQSIQSFIEKIPPRGTADEGITLVVTEEGFDLSDASPSFAERNDPLQKALLRLLQERLASLSDVIQRLGNTHPTLQAEIAAYRDFAQDELADLNVPALASLGTIIGGMVKALAPGMEGNSETTALEPETRVLVEGLLDHHARLIMGFTEGRELAARLITYRSQMEGRELQVQQAAQLVLGPMLTEQNLLTGRAKKLLSAVRDSVASKEAAAYETLTESVRVTVRAIASIGRVVGNRIGSIPNAITYASFLAALSGDQNFEVYKAAVRYITTNGAQISAFAANQEDIRRLFSWLLEQFGAQPQPKITSLIGISSETPESAFYMELTVTRVQSGTRDVETSIPGEQRVPLEALLAHSDFWGWPDEYKKIVSKSDRNAEERIYWEKHAVWEISDVSSPEAVIRSNVRMYFYENRADFRFHSGEIARRGRGGDLIRITKTADDKSDYKCELAQQGSQQHRKWLELCKPGQHTSRVFAFEVANK